LQAMFDLSGAEKMHSDLGAYYNDSVIFAVIIGCLFSTPALPYLSDKLLAKLRRNAGMNPILDVSTIACYVCVFYLAITYLAAGTYNPFIYFRF
jgi:alginate O-acetyltransferase complex protein AlgI